MKEEKISDPKGKKFLEKLEFQEQQFIKELESLKILDLLAVII